MDNDDNLLEELLLIEQQLKISCCDDVQTKSEDMEKKALSCWEGYVQVGMKKGKNGKMVPNCVPIKKKTEIDETEISEKSEKQKIRDPKGGLTAAGRAYFKRTEGANLKPGVKGAANTPEKMRRKGSFLTRFFTNPSGPLVDNKGRATRLALSAAAWGERVPKNAEDAARLAEKGRNLLDRYKNTKEKSDELDMEIKNLGSSIGQMAGTSPTSDEAIDHDGDGKIFDGTENEQSKPQKQREPYKKLSNSFLEKRRRREVQRELRRQGITPTRMGRIAPEEDAEGQIQNQIYDRPEKERDARAAARANFNQDADRKRFVRNQLKKQGITANAKKEDRDEKERAARRAARAEYDKRASAGEPKKKPKISVPALPKPKPLYPKGYEPGKPADRYPDPPKPRDPEAERMERLRPKPRDQKPADRYPDPSRKYPPGQKPTTLEERDRRRGLSGKPRTLEQRDRDKGPSGPITPRRSV